MECKPTKNGGQQKASDVSLQEALKASIKCKCDEYKIIFHSKSILFSQTIADHIYAELQHQKTTTLLINFYEQQIDEIFYQIVSKKSIQLLKNTGKQTKVQLKRLNQIVKDKRSILYKTAGIYSLSSEIFIKDLLRYQKIIDLGTINRIIIRISQKITSYYNYFGWIFTILKREKKKCSVIILCRDVYYYTDFESLEGIYRTFFCEKLVIWPFGRAQIHKSLQTIGKKITQMKHYLEMTQDMKKNQQIFKSLLQIIEKEYNRSKQNKIKGLDVLLKQQISQQLDDQSVSAFQEREFQNLKFFFNCNLNVDSIQLITSFLKLRVKDQERSIWNSNNSTVTDIFEQFEKNIKGMICRFEKIQNQKDHIKVNLVDLIMNFHYSRDQDQMAEPYYDWQAIYNVEYRIQPIQRKNHKIIQIYDIIDKVLQQIDQKILEIQKREKTNKIPGQSNQDDLDQFFEYVQQTLLINCPGESSRRYIHKQLFNKINNSHYIEYLRSVFNVLEIQRQMRIANLKSIYAKIKQKKTLPKMEIQSQKQQKNESSQNKEHSPASEQAKYDLEFSKSSSAMLQIIEEMEIQSKTNRQKPNTQEISVLQKVNMTDKAQFIAVQEKNLQEKPIKRQQVSQQTKLQNNRLKQGLKSKKSPKQIFKQHTVILEQSLYQQIQSLFQVLSRYQSKIFTQQEIKMDDSNSKLKSPNLIEKQNKIQLFSFKKQKCDHKQSQLQNINKTLRQQSLSYEKNFMKEVQRLEFNFLKKEEIKLVPIYNERSQISFYSIKDPLKKVLIVSLFSPKSSFDSDKVTQFNRVIKLINPERVLFYSPQFLQIRNLYLTYSQGFISKLTQIRVMLFKKSFEELSAEHQVKTQNDAFWKISQNRLKLSEYKEDPELRIKKLQLNDKYEKTVDFLNFALKHDPKAQSHKQKAIIYHLSSNERRIIVDSRQFKSALPCYLFFHGFTVIPIQLQTADYIISDQIGIQKKAIQTKDLHMSLKNFRLDKQIKRMCQKFQKPYLLIQCQESEYFRRQSFYDRGIIGQGIKTGKSGRDVYRTFIRQRLGELVKKFPRLRILWSNNVKTSCDYFKALKKNQPEPQIGKYMTDEKQEKEKLLDLNESDQEKIQKSQLKDFVEQ